MKYLSFWNACEINIRKKKSTEYVEYYLNDIEYVEKERKVSERKMPLRVYQFICIYFSFSNFQLILFQ